MTIRIIIRSLHRRLSLNILRIFGLGISLAAVVVMVVYLSNELSYDKFHTHSDRIFRFTVTSPGFFEGKHFARIPNAGIIPEMKANFPAIDDFVRLAPVRGGVIKYKEEFFQVDQAFECDSTFFNIFDVSLVAGNTSDVLISPGSMVLSETLATIIFGEKDPLGEIITLPAGQYYGTETDFTVKGVMRELPSASHFHPQFITTPANRTVLDNWAWVYLLIKENIDQETVSEQLTNYINEKYKAAGIPTEYKVHLQKLTDIHLRSGKQREIEANSNMTSVYTVALAALLLFLVAIANYSNLNMGMASFSLKFLFISRASGGSSSTGLKFFLAEGIIILLVSYITSIVILIVSGGFISGIVEAQIIRNSTTLILITALIFGVFCLLSAILPALPRVINAGSTSLSGNNTVMKGVVIFQFVVSVALIAALAIAGRQTAYAQRSGLGAGNKNIICFSNVHTYAQDKFGLFKEELLRLSSIESVTAMFEPPGGEAYDMFPFEMEGFIAGTDESSQMIGVFPCDYSFPSIFRLNFLSGSDFSATNTDVEGSGEYIINETAMLRLNYSNPDEIIGKAFRLVFDQGGISIPSGKITGVVTDFHLASLRKPVEPLVLFKREKLWLLNFVVSFREGSGNQGINDTKEVWDKVFPGYPFQFEYVDNIYRGIYRKDLMQVRLLFVFSVISLLICTLGLLGLSILTINRRKREIAIRKTHGASTSVMLIMLNMYYVRLAAIATVISIPFTWFAMNRWLEDFAYKTSINIGIFILAGIFALVITLFAVSVLVWKAASENPARSLRYE